ncbi:hypothetical protein LCGC14_2546500 [marine sediment metagenome]|uniref:Uncharacterized protein n=1 Tax=marine sediment metagenome TaxID=412755 RepID=A0A0F9AP57_9ZZZZ
MPVSDEYYGVVAVEKPFGFMPGSCNCACKAAPVAVLKIGTSRATQAVRLCMFHAQKLRDELAAFLAARSRVGFKRRGPKIGPA